MQELKALKERIENTSKQLRDQRDKAKVVVVIVFPNCTVAIAYTVVGFKEENRAWRDDSVIMETVFALMKLKYEHPEYRHETLPDGCKNGGVSR